MLDSGLGAADIMDDCGGTDACLKNVESAVQVLPT